MQVDPVCHFSTGSSEKLARAASGLLPLKPRMYMEENFKVGKLSPQNTNLYLILKPFRMSVPGPKTLPESTGIEPPEEDPILSGPPIRSGCPGSPAWFS